MKIEIPILLLALMALNAVTSLNLVSGSKQTKTERKLSSTSVIDSKINEEIQKVSIEKIREEIIDLHKNVKICIDEEFAKEPADILPFDEILRICAGDNYSIVIRFYHNINFQIKEIIKEKVKGELKNGYCDNILFMCIEYFKVLEMFIEKDFDLMKAIELNRPELERKIDEDRLNYLVRLTEREVGDYNVVRQDLLDERRYLSQYFTEQFNLYKERFGQNSYTRDDTLISEDHVENASEDLSTHYSSDNGKFAADESIGVPTNNESHYSDGDYDFEYLKH